MIKVGCKILLKKEVLDTKGRAVLKLLQKEDTSIQNCSYGKYLELDIETKEPKQALEKARILAQKILHNDLIETFELEIINQT